MTKKKKLNKALLCVIIDRSGSMAGKEDDVVGGINKFIEEQKALPGEAWLTISQFDHEFEVVCDAKRLEDVEPMPREKYIPRGSTALLDAVGRAVKSIEAKANELNPDKVIVVTITDGQENSSHEFTKAKIKEIIKSKEKDGKWSFVYFGADVNAFDEAAKLGYASANTANYSNTHQGTQCAYQVMTCSVSNLRNGCSDAGLGVEITEEKLVRKIKK